MLFNHFKRDKWCEYISCWPKSQEPIRTMGDIHDWSCIHWGYSRSGIMIHSLISIICKAITSNCDHRRSPSILNSRDNQSINHSSIVGQPGKRQPSIYPSIQPVTLTFIQPFSWVALHFSWLHFIHLEFAPSHSLSLTLSLFLQLVVLISRRQTPLPRPHWLR